jgi:hypothetical protein
LDITVLIGEKDEPQPRMEDGFAKSPETRLLGERLDKLVLLIFACDFLFAGDSERTHSNSSVISIFFVGIFGPTPTLIGVDAFFCSIGCETIPVTAALKASISCWELSTKC